jgi:integrase
MIKTNDIPTLFKNSPKDFLPLLQFAAYSGADFDDILALDWDCFKKQNCTITFYRKHPYTIPVTDKLAKILDMRINQTGCVSGKIFADWDRAKCRAILHSLGAYMHTIRAEFMNELAKQGVGVLTISLIIGQKDTEYAYVDMAELEAAMNKISY